MSRLSRVVAKSEDYENKCLRPLRDHRRRGGVKVLLFGTSIVKRLRSDYKYEVWDKFFKDLVFNLGVGGDNVKSTRDRIHRAEIQGENYRNLHTVFIHTGSNDAQRCEPDFIAKSVIRCVADVQEINPNVRVIISEILPRLNPKKSTAVDGEDENSIITKANGLLHEYCLKINIQFLENTWAMNVDKEHYKDDGVHLSLRGSKTFAENIRRLLQGDGVSQMRDTFTPLSAVAAAAYAVTSVLPKYALSWCEQADTFIAGLARMRLKDASQARDNVAKAAASTCWDQLHVPSTNSSHLANDAVLARQAATFASGAVDSLNVDSLVLSDSTVRLCDVSLRECVSLGDVSCDTDAEPEWKDKGSKKEKVKKKGHQEKSRSRTVGRSLLGMYSSSPSPPSSKVHKEPKVVSRRKKR